LRGLTEDVVRLRRLWDEQTHRPFPATGDDPRVQEVALYSSWLGSIVEVALQRRALDPHHAEMLSVRRAEGNEGVFRAAGELGPNVRSYVAHLIAIEDLLAVLPVE
jgi:hypothetical protein